jgi:hypothetical protein
VEAIPVPDFCKISTGTFFGVMKNFNGKLSSVSNLTRHACLGFNRQRCVDQKPQNPWNFPHFQDSDVGQIKRV